MNKHPRAILLLFPVLLLGCADRPGAARTDMDLGRAPREILWGSPDWPDHEQIYSTQEDCCFGPPVAVGSDVWFSHRENRVLRFDPESLVLTGVFVRDGHEGPSVWVPTLVPLTDSTAAFPGREGVEAIGGQNMDVLWFHPGANPLCVSGEVLAVVEGEDVKGLNVESGAVEWSAPIGTSFNDASCVHDRILFVTWNGEVHGVSVDDGHVQLLSNHERTGSLVGTRGAMAFYYRTTGVQWDETRHFLRAVSLDEGEILWEVEIVKPVRGDPRLADLLAYSDEDLLILALQSDYADFLEESYVQAFSLKTGQHKWTVELPGVNHLQRMAYQGDHVVTWDSPSPLEARVTSIQVTTGMIEWELDLPTSPIYHNLPGGFLLHAGYLFAGGSTEILRFAN